MILNDIILQKRKDLEEFKQRMPLARLQRIVEKTERPKPRSFKHAVSSARDLNIIAELKKTSPSEGVLREDFQPLRIATLYEYAGACAISILTEPHFFKGRTSYLKTVRQVTKLPLLRKDFIFEPYQVYETALLDADAFLLIASLLSETELKDLIALGRKLKMDALVEVHSDAELKKAVDAGASILGINNRDLKTLTVDPENAKRLIPHVPKGIPVVVESGLKTHEELMTYKSIGASAFLIGSTLMKSRDIAGTLAKLLGKKEALVTENPE
ncbi:MAG TPA: indole-3-glycerol phosphate synthase TrpC [Candidatus Omnitrophota bacterium]|nr:indole-3-glycerol phosphate synthase TrpC [Candidatus Omnitrophota bacterium]HPS37148.1 indole-3-glycerol phosphate synthase TrpC [Candidatus Omnitrophota bacterium]